MNIPQPAGQQMKIPDALNKGVENISSSVNAVKGNITNAFNQFSQQTQAGVGASTQFLQSNTIVAKLAFIIIAIIGFLFLLNLGISLIAYFASPATNPYLVKGMIDGAYAMVVPQDPKNSDYLPISRSNNENKGIEFTWSFWIYINDLGTSSTKYQHIFNKGDNTYNSSTNISSVNNAPGVYLGPDKNNLHIVIDTVDGTDKNNVIDIDNIPIRKWVNVAIRMQNLTVDVYVNGTVSSRLVLNNTPKQNYNDVYICQSTGAGCFYMATIETTPYVFDIPTPYDSSFSYMLKIIDSNNCIISGTTTVL